MKRKVIIELNAVCEVKEVGDDVIINFSFSDLEKQLRKLTKSQLLEMIIETKEQQLLRRGWRKENGF